MKVNSLCDLGRNYTVEGSDDSKLLKEFNTMYSNGVRSLDSLANLYSETRPTPDNDARRTALLREYTQRYVKIKREHIAFIVKNASSMAAVYALYQRLPNDEALFNANDDRVYYRMVARLSRGQIPGLTACNRTAAGRQDAGRCRSARTTG